LILSCPWVWTVAVCGIVEAYGFRASETYIGAIEKDG
jgi:hypothetical protein